MRNYWTKEEDEIIFKYVSSYPNNLSYGLEQAAKIIKTHTPYAVSRRYYSHLRKQKQVLSIISDEGLSTLGNQKNAPRRKDSNEEESVIIIQKLLNKLSRNTQIKLVEHILQI